jgi:hypothetical protein
MIINFYFFFNKLTMNITLRSILKLANKILKFSAIFLNVANIRSHTKFLKIIPLDLVVGYDLFLSLCYTAYFYDQKPYSFIFFKFSM